MIPCIRCKNPHTKKNGRGRHLSQRFFCGICNSTFTISGKRWTYTPEFKQQIIDEYCHQKIKAQKLLQKHKISSATLIKRKKAHQSQCSCWEEG